MFKPFKIPVIEGTTTNKPWTFDFKQTQMMIPRVTDYFDQRGWAMEPVAFAGLWRTIGAIDFGKHLAAGPFPRPEPNLSMAASRGGKNIAVIRMTGTLMKAASSLGGTSTVQLRKDVRSAANDPNVDGILLDIYSPGGTVAGTEALASEVKAARKKKLVFAHMEDLGASAAYWIASQASAIYAGPTALIGSIGTILTIYDASAAAEREGVKALVFATGPLKGAGTPGSPVTDEQAAHFQQLVNETQTHFDAAVKQGRKMSATQLAAVRTGGVFPAGEALERGLIDGINSFDQALEALAAAK